MWHSVVELHGFLQDSKPSEFDPRLHRYNTSLLSGSEAGYEIPVMHIHLQAVLVFGDLYTGGA